MADQACRGGREKGEQPAIAGAQHQHVADEDAAAENPQIGARQRAGPDRVGPERGRGFPKRAPHGDESDDAVDHQEPEDRAPAEGDRQMRAQDGPDDRRDSVQRHDIGEHLRRPFAVEQVPDDGARQHRSRAGREPLDEAEGEKGFDRGRERAARDRRHEHGECDKKNRPPAEAVGDRPVNELTPGDPGQEDAEAELDRAVGDTEIGRCQRHRRQGGIDRQRQRRHQHAEKHRCGDEPEPVSSAVRGFAHAPFSPSAIMLPRKPRSRRLRSACSESESPAMPWRLIAATSGITMS